MKNSARFVVPTLLVPFALVLACGGNAPEPVAPPSSDQADAAPAATAAAEVDAGGAGEAPVAPVATAPANPPSAASNVLEQKDECTPVGIEFEKRARPKLKECYAAGKKKDPNLEGTVKIKITVDVKGKIKSTKVIEKTLPDQVANCMLKVVKTTPFPEVEKCWDASITIPMTFPTPR
jgi:hypothetical protein